MCELCVLLCGICTCKHIDMYTSCFLCVFSQEEGEQPPPVSRGQHMGSKQHGKGGGTRSPPSQLGGGSGNIE